MFIIIQKKGGAMTLYGNKKQEKSIGIKKSAMELFEKKGIEKTSIRNIMKNSGYGLGTFYLYFKDKKELEEKIALDIAKDLFVDAEKNISEEKNHAKRYITFVNYIMDYLIENPLKLQLISKNLNWALYSKIENGARFEAEETTLEYILNRFEKLIPESYFKSQKLYIISLTLEIMLSSCKYALTKDYNLSIDEMKTVLFRVIEKIFN